MADRVVILADGEVVTDGPARDGAVRLPRLRAPGDQGAAAPDVAHRRRGRRRARAVGMTGAGSSRSGGRPGLVVVARRRRRARGLRLALRRARPSSPHARQRRAVVLRRCCSACSPRLPRRDDGRAPRRQDDRRARRRRPRPVAAMRLLSAGTAGLEPMFFVVIVAGRVLGPGVGFVSGVARRDHRRPAHRRGRAVAAVPDDLRRRHRARGRTAARGRRQPGGAVGRRRLRPRDGPGLRRLHEPLVLAVPRRPAPRPAWASCPVPRSARTSATTACSTSPPHSGGTCREGCSTPCSCSSPARPCSASSGARPAGQPSTRPWSSSRAS